MRIALCSLRRTTLVAFTVLIVAFVTLYPYLGVTGFCDYGGCPESSQISQASSTALTCLAAVLVAVPAALVLSSFYRRRDDHHRRPGEPYLSPDPRPPRLFL
jgi:hypothetical protein